MTTDWTGNEDYNEMIREGLEEEKPLNFEYSDRKLFHALFGTFLVRFLRELEDKKIISFNGMDKVDTAEAVIDIYSDRFIEILDRERPFNW